MNNNNANQAELAPQGNANFPTNPPPVVANPQYQYVVHPMPNPPQAHQGQFYHQPQYVPMIAPPMPQLWPLGQQQEVMQQITQMQRQMQQLQQQMQQLQHQVNQMQHQMQQNTPWNQNLPMAQMIPVMHQDPQQMVHHWPYAQQPTNADGQQGQSPQTQSGHLAPENALQAQNYNNVQQQVQEPLVPMQETHAPLMASPTQQQEAERQQHPQWNVEAPEFLPRHVPDEVLSTSSSGTGSEEEEASIPEQSSEVEMKTMTPPPAELEELAVEASPERLQDVISLEAPASEMSVSNGEKAGNAWGRSPSPETTPVTEDVLVEHIDNRVGALALEDVGVLEDVTAETSNKDEPSTSATSSEMKQVHCSAESRKKQKKEALRQKKEAEKLAKKLKEEKEIEDATALEEAFSSNASHHVEKGIFKAQLMEYVESEKKRRREFQNNGFKLPSGTEMHWMSADIYMWRKMPDNRPKLYDQRFHDRMMTDWVNICKRNPLEAPLASFIEALREFHDEVTNSDLVYLMEMMLAYRAYMRPLRGGLLSVIFNIGTLPPIVALGRDQNSTIIKYLNRHAVLRMYTNGEVTDPLTDEEKSSIAAFKENRWDGMCIVAAQIFFERIGEAYWNHKDREQKPFIKRNAAVFRYLSTIPSPILAFDASFCFPNKMDLKSNTRYAILVMGNDEVPPYEE